MKTFEELRAVYEGSRVLLTGHTGFKGTWMLLILKALGADVKGYALPPLEGNALFHEVRAEMFCDSVIADVRNRDKVHREIEKFEPDFIFHMAAQALVLESYKNPVETYQTNVMGTLHLLDALRDMDFACNVVVVTTDKVYENKEREEAYRENEALGGYDPYSNSKACCELVADSYRSSFFNPDKYETHNKAISTARSGNVIGGGDWSENRIIPDLARALTSKESVLIRNPDSVRPWQHVLDPLNGYLVLGAMLAEDPVKYAQSYNFGPESSDRLTVKELVETGINIWGSGGYQVSQSRNKPHEAKLLRLNIDKAKEELEWHPKMDSQKSIEMTLEWYKACHSGEDQKKYTEAQIKEFYNL
jgi:CDP-glucose 4,6-dehydratase